MVLAMMLAVACGTLVLAAPQSPVTAQPKRAVMPKELANGLPVSDNQLHVVLKLVEQRADVVRDGRILARDVLDVIGSRRTMPFFHGLAKELQQIRARQIAATPAGDVPPVDLALYFDVATASGAATRELVARLNALDTVEIAYARELATPPPATSCR